MTQEEILAGVQEIVRSVLKNDSINISSSTTVKDVDGWDSLSHTMIVAQVEKRFCVKFGFREIMKFHNVGDMCNAVSDKIK